MLDIHTDMDGVVCSEQKDATLFDGNENQLTEG